MGSVQRTANMSPNHEQVIVRQTREEDIPGVQSLARLVYPFETEPWPRNMLESHLRMFPEGQSVAEDTETGEIVGMTASLIVTWNDYTLGDNYSDFTRNYWFTNHDHHGNTLYAAEVMTHPNRRGEGIGKKLYAWRRELVRQLGLSRIRAGARLRGYGRYADRMSAEEYTIKVINGELSDPTLSFQLKQGFRVLFVVADYFEEGDPESLGYAAIIEWINHQVATRRDTAGRPRRFGKKRGKRRKSSGDDASQMPPETTG
jgi:GNAT superfamily N-acetyltransferase